MMVLEIIAIIIIVIFLLNLARSFHSTFSVPPTVNPTPKVKHFTVPNPYSATSQIYKQDFEKDVVYLYQFPRTNSVPNLSSFCLKVETFLRAFKIPHEIIETGTLRSRNGTLPFIELNGEHIPDSDLIEVRLRKHFNVPSLPAGQEAQAVAICRLADNHLLKYGIPRILYISLERISMFSIIIKYKSAEKEWYDAFLRGFPGPAFLKTIIHPIFKTLFLKKVHVRTGAAIGNFTEDEADMLCHKDLQAIQDSISGRFLFGDKISPVRSYQKRVEHVFVFRRTAQCSEKSLLRTTRSRTSSPE